MLPVGEHEAPLPLKEVPHCLGFMSYHHAHLYAHNSYATLAPNRNPAAAPEPRARGSGFRKRLLESKWSHALKNAAKYWDHQVQKIIPCVPTYHHHGRSPVWLGIGLDCPVRNE